ncbi:cAMP phosphodiesterase [Synechococcus sp. UW140]|uniref:cAMP phosphodiesterase n=1 Tax=Synechococcus sp. UW140 TaxID=368503 RepID=UPI0025E2A2A5|nr:cAMP phosphodiesterase [Synechococcus sp. UW140]
MRSMVQHGLVLSKKIVVLRQLISASALLALSTFSSITAVQAQVGPKPASEAEMTLYTRISALNACIAAANGVDFNKSIGIAGETLTQVLQGQNGGAIQQLGAKALPLEELRKGSINSVLIGVSQVCPDLMPADVRDKVKQALQQQGKPAK